MMKPSRFAISAFVPALLLSGCMMMHGRHGGPSKAICPVSGETVKVKADTPSMTWKGRRLYFSSEGHLLRFAAAPDSFKTPGQAPPSGAHEEH